MFPLSPVADNAAMRLKGEAEPCYARIMRFSEKYNIESIEGTHHRTSLSRSGQVHGRNDKRHELLQGLTDMLSRPDKQSYDQAKLSLT